MHRLQIQDILRPERVLLLTCSSKQEALDTLIDCLAATPEVTDSVALRREVYAREKLMSTGLGVGFGVPHVRIPSVRNLVMAVGINKQEIPDYTTLDDTYVRVVCMIAAHDDQHVPYLKALSMLRPLMKNPAARHLLYNIKSAEAAYDLLCEYCVLSPGLD